MKDSLLRLLRRGEGPEAGCESVAMPRRSPVSGLRLNSRGSPPPWRGLGAGSWRLLAGKHPAGIAAWPLHCSRAATRSSPGAEGLLAAPGGHVLFGRCLHGARQAFNMWPGSPDHGILPMLCHTWPVFRLPGGCDISHGASPDQAPDTRIRRELGAAVVDKEVRHPWTGFALAAQSRRG